MSHHEDRFETADGLRLHQCCWLPEGDPVAAVIVVHGLTEHGGRYAGLAGALSGHGYAVYAVDLRGHGKSEGSPAFIRAFDDHLADVALLVDRVRSRQPGKPLFLFGHSMGGAILALWAITRQPEVGGLVLSAPPVRVGDNMFPILRRLAGILSRLAPRLRITRLGAKMLSRDPEVVAQFQGDPLVFHGRFPVRTGAEILRAGRQIEASMEDLRCPLLLLHGTGDVVTDSAGTEDLFTRAGSRDKTLKLYPGLYHDLLHEPEKEEVTADIVQWLNARLAGA